MTHDVHHHLVECHKVPAYCRPKHAHYGIRFHKKGIILIQIEQFICNEFMSSIWMILAVRLSSNTYAKRIALFGFVAVMNGTIPRRNESIATTIRNVNRIVHLFHSRYYIQYCSCMIIRSEPTEYCRIPSIRNAKHSLINWIHYHDFSNKSYQ